MAKGDVVLKFDANTAAFVQSVLKAKEATDAAAGSTKKFTETATKGGDEVSKVFKEIAGHIGMVTSVSGAAVAALELLKKGWENVQKQREERAGLFIDQSRSLNEALAASGRLKSAGDIRSQINQMVGQPVGGRTFSAKDMEGTLVSVLGQMGSRGSTDDVMAAMHVGLKARAAGMSDEAANQVAANYARFKFEGLSPETAENYAYSARVYKRGELSERDARFLARAKDKDFAARLLFAGGLSDENSKTLSSLLDDSHNNADSIKRQLEKQSGKQAPALANLQKGMGQASPLSLDQAVNDARGADLATHIVQTNADVKAFREQTKRLTGPKDAEIADANEMRRAVFERMHPTMSSWGIQGGRWDLGYSTEQDDEQAFAKRTGRPIGGNAQQTAELLRAMLDELRNQTSAIRDENSGGPALKNGKEGQQ